MNEFDRLGKKDLLHFSLIGFRFKLLILKPYNTINYSLNYLYLLSVKP